MEKEYQKLTNRKDEQLQSWHKSGHGKTVQHSVLGSVKKKLLQKPQTVVLASMCPTTKLCTQCGKVHDGMKLRERTFECECGICMDRDVHADRSLVWLYKNQIGVGRTKFKRVEIQALVAGASGCGSSPEFLDDSKILSPFSLAGARRLYYPACMDTFLLLYFCLGLLHLSLRSEGCKRLGSLTKVMLMPTLMGYVLSQGMQSWLLASLGFATLGDYLLTKGHKGPYFTPGMFGFAFAHLCYSIHLLSTSLSWQASLIALLVLSLPFSYLLTLLKNSPHGIRFALYAANLFIMASLCIGSTSVLASLGALAFIISDGMIAMEILDRHSFTTVTEMAVYMTAQLMLVLGLMHV